MASTRGHANLWEALRRHSRAALAIGGVVLALSLIAQAQRSHPIYDSGEPTYNDGATYDSTEASEGPLSPEALSAMTQLQYLRNVIDRARDLSRTRRAVALAEIDLALLTLQNSNAVVSSGGGSHPTYDSARVPGQSHPTYDVQGPIYDRTAAPAPKVASDSRSSAVALRHLAGEIEKSPALTGDVRSTVSGALKTAAEELEGNAKSVP